MNQSLRPMSGLILSGGKNIRMGQNKAFIQIEGIPIIQRIVDLFQELFREIIIIANERQPYLRFKAKIHGDLFPDAGALGGLYTGLFYSSFFYSFAVACDMPFLRRPVIEYLLSKVEGYDVTIPRTEDGYQPLHAAYSKNCIGPIERILGDGKRKIVDLLPFVHVNVLKTNEILPIDSKMESFININSLADLSRYQGGGRLA